MPLNLDQCSWDLHHDFCILYISPEPKFIAISNALRSFHLTVSTTIRAVFSPHVTIMTADDVYSVWRKSCNLKIWIHISIFDEFDKSRTASHCSTLRHTATHCNGYIALCRTHCNTCIAVFRISASHLKLRNNYVSQSIWPSADLYSRVADSRPCFFSFCLRWRIPNWITVKLALSACGAVLTKHVNVSFNVNKSWSTNVASHLKSSTLSRKKTIYKTAFIVVRCKSLKTPGGSSWLPVTRDGAKMVSGFAIAWIYHFFCLLCGLEESLEPPTKTTLPLMPDTNIVILDNHWH